MLGVLRQRLIITGQRVIEPSQPLQRIAPVVPSLRQLGIDGDGRIQIHQCFLEMPQAGQQQSARIAQIRMVRIKRDGPVITGQRFAGALHHRQHIAVIEQRKIGIGMDC